jgi:uncharacterized protein
MNQLKNTLLVCLLVSANLVYGQKQPVAKDSTQSYVAMIGKYHKNAVVLRWAPSNNSAFFASLNYGYKVERTIILIDSNFQKINWVSLGVFLPADSSTWQKQVDTTNSFQVIAAQAALGKFRRDVGDDPNLGQILKRYEEESNLFGFSMMSADIDPTAATLLGLRYEDKDVLPNCTYGYRITPLTPKSIIPILSGECFVETRKEGQIYPPELLEWGYENHVRLDWYTQMHKDLYSGYYVERGDKNGKNFVRLNKFPIALLENPAAKKETFQLTHLDEVPRDYEVYSYRLVGIDAFGIETVSPQVIYSYGRDRTPPNNASEVTAEDYKEEAIKIKWKKKDMEKDFVGYNVLRAENPEGPYEILNDKPLPQNLKEFLDKNPDVMSGSFYRIEVVDTAGNRNWSLGVHGFLKDTEAPAQPTGLVGKCDSSGVVTLKWTLGPEMDIMGYRVYYNNQEDHEMTNLTPYPIQDTVFTDTVTLASLTDHRFYQIVAVDRHQNHSVRSAVIEVQLPDTIPPVKPLFSSFLVTDTAVYMSWIPSTSEDAIKHNLYRKQGNSEYSLLQTISDSTVSSITDSKVQIGQVYTYRIEAIDDDGNKSGFPKEVSGKIYDSGKRTPIANVQAAYVADKKHIKLTWKYPPSSKYKYVVYRSYNGSTFAMFKTIAGTENYFEDYKLLGPGTYTYAVRAFYSDGGDSGLSNKVTVTLE